MPLDTPMDLLKEYENQRSKIISIYYARLEQIICEFTNLFNTTQEEIESFREECQEKMRQAEKLAEIASKFYESAQRMLQKAPFNSNN